MSIFKDYSEPTCIVLNPTSNVELEIDLNDKEVVVNFHNKDLILVYDFSIKDEYQEIIEISLKEVINESATIYPFCLLTRFTKIYETQITTNIQKYL